MRDATRGGLAAVANEMGEASGVTLVLQEQKIPVDQAVQSFCNLLGFTPWELANEGKLVAAVPAGEAEKALAVMRAQPLGKQASLIGQAEKAGKVPAVLETSLGVRTILEMPRGEHLPRIC